MEVLVARASEAAAALAEDTQSSPSDISLGARLRRSVVLKIGLPVLAARQSCLKCVRGSVQSTHVATDIALTHTFVPAIILSNKREGLE